MTKHPPPPTKFGPQAPMQAKAAAGSGVHAPPPSRFAPPAASRPTAPLPPKGNDGTVQPASLYFRGASSLFAGVGAVAGWKLTAGGAMIGGPVGALIGGAVGGALTYGFDYVRSHQAQAYEKDHPGYHSVKNHSAWYSGDNLLGRTNKPSTMVAWDKSIVKHYKVSSKFATDNWQIYSIGQGEKRLKALDAAATILAAKPAPQAPGYNFCIRYSGWTTGFNYSAAHPEGQETDLIFYNYIKSPATSDYFLVQHYPVPTVPATVNAPTITVSTWRPV